MAAIRCVRGQKTGLSLEDLVASRPKNEQSQVEAALAKAPPKPLAFLAGDVRMSAEWTGGIGDDWPGWPIELIQYQGCAV